jgi:uncharacterized protein (TIGR00304 family)
MQLSEGGSLFELGIGLAIVGIIFVIIAIVVLSNRHTKKGRIHAAGAVVVGPIPIVFGADKKSLKTVLQLSIVLTILVILASLIYYFLQR